MDDEVDQPDLPADHHIYAEWVGAGSKVYHTVLCNSREYRVLDSALIIRKINLWMPKGFPVCNSCKLIRLQLEAKLYPEEVPV